MPLVDATCATPFNGVLFVMNDEKNDEKNDENDLPKIGTKALRRVLQLDSLFHLQE
jgi:hypothetical protein